MANITAGMVKELRDKTDAGMMDCKKALEETNGDMEAAVEYLRKAGITKAEKRSARTVKEGKIYALVNGGKAVMVEVLSETDFVAKNEKFFEYIKAAAARILQGTSGDGDISEKAQALEAANLTQLIATIGENMQIRRVFRFETAGQIAAYLHLGGKVGVMIDVEGQIPAGLSLNDICMHIAAFKPSYVCSCEIPKEVIAKEKEIAAAQITGKPADMVEKIVGGKINKWFTEVCLVNQPWIRDDKTTLAKIAPAMKIKRFLRWEIGQEL